MLGEKGSGADNFPGDSEKECSSIVLYRETRASGYKRGWLLIHLDRDYGRQKWQEERDGKRKKREEEASGIRNKKDRIGWYTCGEKSKEQGNVPANNYQDHLSRESLIFFSLSLCLFFFLLLNLRLFFLSSDIFSRRETVMREKDNAYNGKTICFLPC